MSVIWSGVTEEGAVVPVQVTAEGKVVAVGDGPEGDYLKLTGGNLTGDLTVNEQITLATDGSATFAGDVDGKTITSTHGLVNRRVSGVVTNHIECTTDGFNNFKVEPAGTVGIGSSGQIILNSDGSANFAGNVNCTSDGINTAILVGGGYFLVSRTFESATCFQGFLNNGSTTQTSIIRANGSAEFSGDVVIGSRGEKWLIRESNGVAMLVQQTLLKQPREIEKLRDLPNELDLIEAALNEIMDKLRMTPPAGWPVWDGQSEVTSDNDNA